MEYRIEEVRRSRGWSQAELARRSGLTQQAIQRYESGEREPKVSAVVSMAAALGVTISYLLGLDRQSTGAGMTDDEKRLVALYRATDARGRSAIMAVAESQINGAKSNN